PLGRGGTRGGNRRHRLAASRDPQTEAQREIAGTRLLRNRSALVARLGGHGVRRRARGRAGPGGICRTARQGNGGPRTGDLSPRGRGVQPELTETTRRSPVRSPEDRQRAEETPDR